MLQENGFQKTTREKGKKTKKASFFDINARWRPETLKEQVDSSHDSWREEEKDLKDQKAKGEKKF